MNVRGFSLAKRALCNGAALTGLLLAAGCDWSLLDGLVLRPTPGKYGAATDYGYASQALQLPVAPGRQIHVEHVRSSESRMLLAIIPGSDRNKTFYTQFLPLFIPYGIDVLLMDYEGFGESPGVALLDNLADSGRAALRYATAVHPTVVGFGISIGTPVLARVAPEFDLKACVFEASVNLVELPASWLIDRGLNIPLLTIPAVNWVSPQTPEDLHITRFIKEVAAPKLFMHSPDDEVTPYAVGRQIFGLAPEPKEFRELAGGHGRMAQRQPAEYGELLRSWLLAQLSRPE